jgi:two-component system sensor histidine kinase BaeS
MRGRFFRRAVLLALVLVLPAIFGLASLISAAADRLGLGGSLRPLPVLVIVFVAAAVGRSLFGTMRHFVSPLGAVMEAADQVADGDYSVRVNESGAPPIRALARSFNTMTTRLQDADRVRRELMADVAHELRTPLSVLQGRLEGLTDGVYPLDRAELARLLDQTQVLSRLIDDLRTLALSDAGALRFEPEATDVPALIRDVLTSLEAQARERSVRLLMREPMPSVTLDLDPVRLREVFTNLVANGLQHTPPGGTITASIADTVEQVTIEIADTGRGIAPADLARVFDRFYKGGDSRGSGLGLAIARSLIIAHGGTIDVSSQLNEGTTVTVRLPRHREQ